jgi:hypothetical protein
MKALLFIALLVNGFQCSHNTITVYICESQNAKRYHYKQSCPGLGNCRHRIIKTTLDRAKEDGKTCCGWER